MRILIVGGGNVGYYLVKTLMAEKHHIMLIDSSRARCERVDNAFGGPYVEVTHGDGTSADCLREAGVCDAEALIAVTGQDQNNLVCCQLAKDYFGVKRTIARVKNPKNIRVFEQLGVDSVISSTARIAGSIDQELDWADVNSLLTRQAAHVRVRRSDRLLLFALLRSSAQRTRLAERHDHRLRSYATARRLCRTARQSYWRTTTRSSSAVKATCRA